jgi:hypothetical protein
MNKLFVALYFLLAQAAPALADSAPTGLPVLDGALVKVTSVRATSEHIGVFNETILATLEFHAGCVGATSFVVVPGADGFSFQVFEAHSRPEPGTANCGAIMISTQEIKIATFYEVTPNPALIKVNGVGITPTPAP